MISIVEGPRIRLWVEVKESPAGYEGWVAIQEGAGGQATYVEVLGESGNTASAGALVEAVTEAVRDILSARLALP